MTDRVDIDGLDPEIDERLRRALHGHVDGIEPTASWTDVRRTMVATSNHRPRRRAAAVVLVAAAAVVVLIGATVAARRAPSDVTVVPAAPGVPASTLVGIAHNDLVELDPDGTEIRTIATGPFAGAPAVSPVDHTIYIERWVRDDFCTKAYAPATDVIGQIVAIPWSGGPGEVVVAHGTAPVLSPDGARLAYLAAQTDTCAAPPELRVAHVLDLTTRQTTPLGFLSAVVGAIVRVGPIAWIAADTLAVAFTSTHSCPSSAPRASCLSTYLQSYRFRDGGVPGAPEGTGPFGHRMQTAPPATDPTVSMADALQVAAVDAMAGEPDGSLVVATVEDERTLVLRRVTITGSGRTEDLARYTPEQLDAGSFLTVGVAVTMSQDPGSDRIALSVGEGEGLVGAWHSATGPPADLHPMRTPATWPAWGPAG